MIICVVGARPNFVKMAPVIKELKKINLDLKLVHTGQHYSAALSQTFFHDLKMPHPDYNLGVGSGSHAEQTAKIMVAFEKICSKTKPSLVVVGGDVNSTLACTLAASKLNIPVAHVESGLRSFDRSMPEETNRVLTDHLADLLFTTEESANKNLKKEGIDPRKIHFVGNTMIDSLNDFLEIALRKKTWEKFGFQPQAYGLVTLHRASNVDDIGVFTPILKGLAHIQKQLPLIFPVHPRTRKQLSKAGKKLKNLYLVDPLSYLEFLGLMAKAKLVLTDSGGIQEETTFLGVPCLTLRKNTERPVTLNGTNRLVELSEEGICDAVEQVLSTASSKMPPPPPLWDGVAAVRIRQVIENWLNSRLS